MHLEKNKTYLALSALFYFVIFDYRYFGIFFILFFVIFGIKLETSNLQLKIFQYLPIGFYLKKYFSGLNNNFLDIWRNTHINDFYLQAQFPDIKIDLYQYSCQYFLGTLSETYFMNLDSCPMGYYRYGPLHHLIRLNLDPNIATYSWITILSLFCLYGYLKITNNNQNYIPLISIIILGPVTNMAYHQLNMDLFLAISAYFLVKNINKEKIFYLNVILITFIALIKQHPVGILLGLGLYFFLTKNYKKLSFILFNLIIFISVNILYFERLTLLSGQPRPSNLYNSSGLLTFSQYLWVNAFDTFGGYRYVLLIYIFIFLFCLIIGKYLLINKTFPIKKIKNDVILMNYPFIFWFLFAGAYANYDYRNLILIILSIFYLKNTNKISVTIFLLLILSSPFPSYFSTQVMWIFSGIKFFTYMYIYTSFLIIALKPLVSKLKLFSDFYED